MTQTTRPDAAPPQDPPCLAALLQGSPSEIYLIDAATLHFVDVNAAARANLQYSVAELAALTPLALAPRLSGEQFGALLAGLDHAVGAQRCLHTEHRRRDGSLYPLALRLLRADRDGQALLIAIGEDLSAPRASAAALELVQSRLNAIVSNTPGLVYQFRHGDDGAVSFPYLSDACQALLGLGAAALQRRPELFLELILADDRKSYLDSMHASRAALQSWNWEGRIWVDAWKDVKWINLRASPRASAGAVQWEGIMSNITESRLEQLEVRQSRARLAELSAHVDRVKEQERTRIAREIHDELGGNLTAIKMALAMLAKRLPADGELPAKAAYLDQLVDRTIDAVHRISLDLRPSMLDLGIVAALEWQSKEFAAQAGLPCHFVSNRKEIELGLDQATALFRIFQEALTNIAKHANASRVTVRLARLRQHISLKISDNGGGIGPADRAKPKSFGIRGMAERANALGGTLTLGRAAGGGTVVAIKIKLPTARETIIAAAAAAPAAATQPLPSTRTTP